MAKSLFNSETLTGMSSAFIDFSFGLFAFIVLFEFHLKHNVIICLGKIDFVTFFSRANFFCLHFTNSMFADGIPYMISDRERVSTFKELLPTPLRTYRKRDEWNWLMDLRVITDTEKWWNLFDVIAGPLLVFFNHVKIPNVLDLIKK